MDELQSYAGIILLGFILFTVSVLLCLHDVSIVCGSAGITHDAATLLQGFFQQRQYQLLICQPLLTWRNTFPYSGF